MVYLRVLGGLDLRELSEGPALSLQSKRAALLVYMALATPRGFHRRDKLLALFWPHLDTPRARNALSQALHSLRQRLGEGVLVNQGEQEVGLSPGVLRCDAVVFEEAVSLGRHAEAMELYRGDLLEGFHPGGALPELERWIDEERDRLKGLALGAALTAGGEEEGRGNLPLALHWYRRAGALAPYAEPVLRCRLDIHHRMGDRAGVVATFDAYARRLREDLDLEPSEEAHALFTRMRGDGRDLVPEAAPPEAATPPQDATASHAGGHSPTDSRRTSPRWLRPDRDTVRAARRMAPAGAALLLLAATGALILMQGSGTATYDPPLAEPSQRHDAGGRSVAVLPLVAPGADPDQQSLGEGFAEELLNTLARVPGLHVTARTSSFTVEGQRGSPREIAARLGVSHLLRSDVARAGPALHIQVQLIRGRDGRPIWSERYERAPGEAFAVQQEIARSVIERLDAALPEDAIPYLPRRTTGDFVAYEAYLKGRYWWNQRTGEALQKSIASFQEAISRDPGYAAPHAGLADAYNLYAAMGFAPGTAVYPRAREAALDALAMDSTLAEAAAALGFALFMHDADPVAAEHWFRYAIERNPNYAPARQWYGQMLSLLGRFDEAAREIELSRRLDPVSLAIQTDWARDAYFARLYDVAAERLQRSIEIEPHYARTHSYLAIVRVEQGRLNEAIDGFQRAIDLAGGWWPSRFGQAGLARAYALAGRKSEARAILRELESSSRYVSPEAPALVSVALGEHGAALDALERAWDERAINQGWLAFDPAWDPLRPDPRFSRLLREMGITAPVSPPTTPPSPVPAPAPQARPARAGS